MEAKEIIREVSAMRGWTQSMLAKEAGYSGQSAIGNMMARTSGMRIDNMVKLVEAMGCELVVRDKMGSKKEWRVTNPEDK